MKQLFAISLAVFLGGCLDVSSEVDKIKNQVNESTKEIHKAVDAVAVAVPGERYLRLIDAIHSGTPEEKAAAQKFIKSAFQMDLEKQYEVTIWFGSTEKSPMKADAFRADIPEKEAVIKHLIGKRLNLSEVPNSFIRPESAEEMKKQINEMVKQGVTYMAGTYSVNRGPDGRVAQFTYNNSFFPIGFDCQSSQPCIGKPNPLTVSLNLANPAGDDRNQRSEPAIRALADAIWWPYRDKPLPIAGTELTVTWGLLDPQQYLIVLISEEDFQRLKDLNVTAAIHEVGNVNARLLNERIYRFTREEFEKNDPVKSSNPTATLRWAAHNMTGNALVSAEMLKALKNLRDLSQKWEAETSKSK